MSDKKPTIGQRTQLERISTADWVLVGEQQHAGEPITYRLVERGTGREIHTLTTAMVESLLAEGWIERWGHVGMRGSTVIRAYCITRAGIEARDRGWQE